MNVLLILGNGFDLNLGFPTAYSHFYDFYLDKDLHPDDTRRNVLKESLYDWKNQLGTDQKDIIDWSDLELAIGAVSKKYKNPTDYLGDFEDLAEELLDYLKSVDRIEIKNLDKIAVQFLDDILRVSLLTDFSKFLIDKSKVNGQTGFTGYLDNNPTNSLRTFLNAYSSIGNSLKLDVMTFNYTSTVERIFEKIKSLNLPADKISLGKVLHIHQELDENGIILGVNSLDQILNKEFHSVYSIYNGLVKPNLIAAFASGTDNECIEAMERADVIILFGVSLGETDSVWWKRLGSIVAGGGKRIIYCPYERREDFAYRSRAIVNRIHNLIHFLLNKFYLSSSDYTKMENLVYPVRKNQMFDFLEGEDLKKEQEKNLEKVKKYISLPF